MTTTPLEPASTAGTATVVLVHGAFAESASWNGVVADLKYRGYSVIAVANPLRGLKEDADYLRSVLDSLSGPVVIAGHSYGGSVMSEAADGAVGVAALVYIASFNLEVGESTAELAAKFPGGELGSALNPVPFPTADGGTGTDLYIQQDKFQEVFAADVAPDIAELMAATQRPSQRPRWRTLRPGRPGRPSRPGPWSPPRTWPSRPSQCATWPRGQGPRPSRSTPPTLSPSPSQARSPT